MNDWHNAEEHAHRGMELAGRAFPVGSREGLRQAAGELRTAIDIYPDNADWQTALGQVLEALGDPAGATAAYSSALAVIVATSGPVEPTLLHRLANVQCETGDLENALATLDRLQQVDGDFEPAYCLRIRILAELEEHDAADEQFYMARLLTDQCSRCDVAIAQSLLSRHRATEALGVLNRVLSQTMEVPPGVHELLGRAQRLKGQKERARRHLMLALRERPADAELLVEFGTLLIECGRYAEAGEKLRRAIELAPMNPVGHLALARWHLSGGAKTRAAGVVDHVLAMAPTFPGANLLRAVCHISQRERAKARMHLQREVDVGSREPGLLMELGLALSEVRMPRLAEAVLSRLSELAPKSASAWQNLAVHHFRWGNFEAGLQCSYEALKLAPGRVELMYNLALAQSARGAVEDALHWTRHALSLAPKDEGLRLLHLRLRLQSVMARVRRVFRGR